MIKMNKWIEKSFDLYNDYGYLDQLTEIYPMNKNKKRPLEPRIKKELKESFEKRNNQKLFKILLKLDKFPIKDSYKAFFDRCKKSETDEIIKKNPETINRICQRIYKVGYENMIKGIEVPIETNRQLGPMFNKWTIKKYNSESSFDTFFNSQKYLTVLNASDDKLTKFVEKKLNINLPKKSDGSPKGLDLVAKVNTNNDSFFVIGEAKFLTDFGGHQNAQLNDALDLIRSIQYKNNGSYKVIPISILDGVCWIKSKNTKMQKRLRGLNEDKIAISALLLDDFFASL